MRERLRSHRRPRRQQKRHAERLDHLLRRRGEPRGKLPPRRRSVVGLVDQGCRHESKSSCKRRGLLRLRQLRHQGLRRPHGRTAHPRGGERARPDRANRSRRAGRARAGRAARTSGRARVLRYRRARARPAPRHRGWRRSGQRLPCYLRSFARQRSGSRRSPIKRETSQPDLSCKKEPRIHRRCNAPLRRSVDGLRSDGRACRERKRRGESHR